MAHTYTEKDTEKFYNREDKIYRSFWDKEGTLHWGLFDKKTAGDFLKASRNLTKFMAKQADINSTSSVLDLGCGNGVVAIWLARHYGCKVVGVDLSGVRIKNAKNFLVGQPKRIQKKVSFMKASATDLPFDNFVFSHVWSQATIYHVHNKSLALNEIFRILKDDGIFVFDDLLKPKKKVGNESKKFIFERLLFDTDFSFNTYLMTLRKIGFKILYARDISDHLKRSYQTLTKILERRTLSLRDKSLLSKYRKFIQAYNFMVAAVENKDLGWDLFICKKIT